jgi:hypothetical protein
MSSLQDLKNKRERLDKQIKDLEEAEKIKLEENKDKIVWTKIPELKIEISQQIYNNKTYAEILNRVNEKDIATHDILFKLRKLTDKYSQFKDFWVFVPNPDKISKDNNYVAGFGANSDGAYLNCYRDPTYRYAGLGVFVVRKISRSKHE